MIDLGILSIVLLSFIVGIWRGMVREVLSLVAWGLSFWLATHWTELLSERLISLINSSAVRHWVAWAILMVSLRILFEIVLKLVNRLVHMTGFTGLDRTFGALFGALRGVVICLLLTMAINALDITEAPWWRSAQLRPLLEQGVHLIRPLLPSF